MNKTVRLVLSIVMGLAVVVLAWVLYSSIKRPLAFDNEYNMRSTEVINKLKDIRTLQEQYKNTNNSYCNDMDSLIDFAFNGKALLVQKFGTVPDNMTESQAIKEGKLRRDTTIVNPLEKLYQEGKLNTPKDKIKDIKFIPYSDGQEFIMKASTLDKGGISVAVFEAKAPIESYTKGMDEQTVINRKAELEAKVNGYAGWKVGDLEQTVTDGNWE
ncbi:MAG: hypothetical protein IJ250_04075 [Bacteroidales bacterium]|nr:hypothetical protein [Bacteroidales bacterium]